MAESINFKNEVYWDSSSISHNKKKLSDILFPVNSIYLSVSSTNPTNYFGGTWVQIAQGRTLVGVDTSDSDFNVVKKTGGEKAHTLTVAELAEHKHTLWFTAASGDLGTNTHYHNYGEGLAFGINNQRLYGRSDMIDNSGGGQAHNNMPPYFTCYIWLRTA